MVEAGDWPKKKEKEKKKKKEKKKREERKFVLKNCYRNKKHVFLVSCFCSKRVLGKKDTFGIKKQTNAFLFFFCSLGQKNRNFVHKQKQKTLTNRLLNNSSLK